MISSFNARTVLKVGSREYEVFRLDAVDRAGFSTKHLPYSLRILLENLLRHEDGATVTRDDVIALARWNPQDAPAKEIAFTPSRVLLQDFTGVPCVVDLAAMRDAMARAGGDPGKINPLQPVDLVIDHSVQVDFSGTLDAMSRNTDLEYRRNRERYVFLRWGQRALSNFSVVPPETGIVHQINLEYLAKVVGSAGDGRPIAFPDTLVGTDSHTTMINGVGVLGWGVGGIEAEAAMLGQPVSMLIPEVIGVRLKGRLVEGVTATDLVLTVTETLRKKGVVDKFVEFFGAGLAELPLADRATVANMSPEYGATCGIFPVDRETLRYLKMSGRSADQIALVETYCRAQGMFHDESTPEAQYSDVVEIDLAKVEPSIAGPKRPQDRVSLVHAARSFTDALPSLMKGKKPDAGGAVAVAAPAKVKVTVNGTATEIGHGSIVIAAITSCTNTSNPSVMIAAGLLAKKAAERGLTAKPWVKCSLAPGSKVVTEYLQGAGLLPALEALRFHVVGYGCTTCIGNSGPLDASVAEAVAANGLVVASVLSGNRNFEGRVHGDVRANYLMSPPLVVAYALAGRVDMDLTREPLGNDRAGKPVYLRDVWPTQKEVAQVIEATVGSALFSKSYATVFQGNEAWGKLPVPEGRTFEWDVQSTYIKHPPYFVDLPATPAEVQDIAGARVLAWAGDSVTTDHISPAGSIKKDSPAGKYLIERGVKPEDFNSYGSRRGNHEVMMRGTFANVQMKNKLVPGIEGAVTRHLPDGAQMSIFDASEKYRAEKVALIVIAGKEYGTGSSRDWAAKGPMLLGVRAVIAKSYERIHRSNLVGMGVLPLTFPDGQDLETLGLTGEETFDIVGVRDALTRKTPAERQVTVRAKGKDGKTREFSARMRINTPEEVQYYKHGGILQYVLRRLMK